MEKKFHFNAFIQSRIGECYSNLGQPIDAFNAFTKLQSSESNLIRDMDIYAHILSDASRSQDLQRHELIISQSNTIDCVTGHPSMRLLDLKHGLSWHGTPITVMRQNAHSRFWKRSVVRGDNTLKFIGIGIRSSASLHTDYKSKTFIGVGTYQ